VNANQEQTVTLACPDSTRALSGGPSLLRLANGQYPHFTLVASEPNATGTGWVVTMSANAMPGAFRVEANCVAVD
jgi:hypothetical protein